MICSIYIFTRTGILIESAVCVLLLFCTMCTYAVLQYPWCTVSKNNQIKKPRRHVLVSCSLRAFKCSCEQAAAGERVQRGARGRASRLERRDAPGATRPTRPRRHVHEAPHLVAHALLEGHLPRRRHARAPSPTFTLNTATSITRYTYQTSAHLIYPHPAALPEFGDSLRQLLTDRSLVICQSFLVAPLPLTCPVPSRSLPSPCCLPQLFFFSNWLLTISRAL